MFMKAEFVQQDDLGIISIRGRLDAASSRDFKDLFSNWARQNLSFVFDLKKVDFIDSTGLGVIVSCLKSLRERKCDLCLVNPSPKVQLILEMTQAYKIFEIYDDRKVAMASLRA